jgi:hypothetical protein
MSARVQVLSLLEAYEAAHDAGNASLKQATWNLYKARHNRGGQSGSISNADRFSAINLRQELRSRVALRIQESGEADAPNLQEESSPSRETESAETSSSRRLRVLDCFTLIDKVQEHEQEKGNRKTMKQETADTSEPNELGLRRRKTGREETPPSTRKTDAKEWTEEYEDDIRDEEQQLMETDPLALFGAFPPRELKLVQAEAVKALQAYIQAANLCVALRAQIKYSK